MSRLQKKCLIVSVGTHLLLATIVLVGPAFLSSSDKTEDVATIEFVPLITTDSPMSGGGNPKGSLPPPAEKPVPPPPKPEVTPPAPPQEKVSDPDPVKPAKPEPAKESKAEDKTGESDSLEPAKSTHHRIKVNTKLVTRHSVSRSTADARADAEARAVADERQRALAALNRAYSSLSGNLSGSTSIELKGPGGGGIPYGNWLSAVKQRYTDAWIVPDGVTDDSATVKVSITIAKDGEVTDTRILKFSGNSLVDQSVRATLDRVRYVHPLPEGSNDDERTVTINFNVKAKQGLG